MHNIVKYITIMSVAYIKINRRGCLQPDDLSLNELLNVILIDGRNTPIARYEFDYNKIKSGIKYWSNDSKIYFSINPSMTYEIISTKQQ